jgi:WD40 repeat protein
MDAGWRRARQTRLFVWWGLKDGVVLEEMEGHGNWVRAVAVSRDGQLIASGDNDGKLIVWHDPGDTGESLTQINQAHSSWIWSLDFSPDL